jgi:hypothetical protein
LCAAVDQPPAPRAAPRRTSMANNASTIE